MDWALSLFRSDTAMYDPSLLSFAQSPVLTSNGMILIIAFKNALQFVFSRYFWFIFLGSPPQICSPWIHNNHYVLIVSAKNILMLFSWGGGSLFLALSMQILFSLWSLWVLISETPGKKYYLESFRRFFYPRVHESFICGYLRKNTRVKGTVDAYTAYFCFLQIHEAAHHC